MAKLKPEYRDLLEPYGEILCQMNEKIFDMPDAELQALSKAVDAVDTGNCWCMIYDAAKWLRVQIDDEFQRRATIASRSDTPTPQDDPQ